MFASASQPGPGPDFSAPIEHLIDDAQPIAVSAMDLLNSYAAIFVVAFLVVLLSTPLVRRIALLAKVTDQPDAARKMHQYPVAYLGGVSVFLGLVIAVGLSYMSTEGVAAFYRSVPIGSVMVGMVAIMFTGLADDVWGLGPRVKIAGQLVAAAALAVGDIGVRVAAGLLSPAAVWLDPILGTDNLVFTSLPAPYGDLIYWAGTALIAVFVLGGCNAANLLDGLDGLLSGVVAVVAVGLLVICVLMALRDIPEDALQEDSLSGARIVLCMALLGAVLGFLPHNFNPASIFLGDCGSLLLGYVCVVIILMLGEYGETHLVFAGLIVFSVPIMDTTLAIIRRWLAGTPMSVADDQHIHHQLRRGLGGVKRAVFAVYGVSMVFAMIGITLAALVMRTQLRVRVVYAIALVLFGFIGAIAVKAARRQRRLAEVRQAQLTQTKHPVDATPRRRGDPATKAKPRQ